MLQVNRVDSIRSLILCTADLTISNFHGALETSLSCTSYTIMVLMDSPKFVPDTFCFFFLNSKDLDVAFIKFINVHREFLYIPIFCFSLKKLLSSKCSASPQLFTVE